MQECPRVFVTSSCFYVLTELHYALNSAFMWRCQHLQSTYMDALVKDVKLWLVRVQHVVCFVSSPNHSKNVWSPNLGNCAYGCIVCWTAQSNPRETAWACVFFFPLSIISDECVSVLLKSLWELCQSNCLNCYEFWGSTVGSFWIGWSKCVGWESFLLLTVVWMFVPILINYINK